MATSSRRQRDFHQREQLMLNNASSLIRRHGISFLTMDKIAEVTEYAKGTVYKHFCSKEDILCGLCVNNLSICVNLFERAVEIEGHSRLKITALAAAYELFTQKFPEEFDLIIAARTSNVREKASKQRIIQIEQLDEKIQELINGIINQAMRDGDLVLPFDMQIRDLGFGLWASSFGLLALGQASGLVAGYKPSTKKYQLLSHISCILDGYGWQPLSEGPNREQDYIYAVDHLRAFM